MRLSTVLLCAILLAAFGTRPAFSDDVTDAAPADNASGFDNVDLVDDGLNGKLGVLRVGSDRSENNLLSVFAALKNITGRTIRLEAQTLYKDADGNWLNGGKAGWITLQIRPHGQLEYRSASLTDDARDFLVRIRLVPSVATIYGSALPHP